MAAYNTFLALTTQGKPILVTSSARKARKLLTPGIRVEVWSNNTRVEVIYHRTRALLDKYVAAEKAYIGAKQAAAEQRNRQRRNRRNLNG